jgi:hypothetical protein
VAFWDRLFRRSRRGDPTQNLPPQQPYVDPGSTSPADAGHQQGEPGQHGTGPGDDPSQPGDPAQSGDPAEYGDPAQYDDPGQPGDAGGGEGGGGDSGGGDSGGGGGDGGGGDGGGGGGD